MSKTIVEFKDVVKTYGRYQANNSPAQKSIAT